MTDGSFTSEVTERLKVYVYRLIDPRNGETFYVGKGVGDRVFQHARGEIAADGEAASDKITRIRRIRLAGFEVAHVIHRHGLDHATAFQVEAALIDAYAGLSNLQSGHGSDEFGVSHSKEIIERYTAPFAEFEHPVMMININRSADEQPVYEATRYAWRISRVAALRSAYILAVRRGMIVGVYQADDWLPAEPVYFPDKPSRPGRYGFHGKEAPAEVQALYLRRRVPDEFRKKGAANPIKYARPPSKVEPEGR